MEGRETPCVQSPLIGHQGNNHEFDGGILSWKGCLRKEIIEEAKRQLWLAGPLAVVNMLQHCLEVISVMVVDHIGELPLSGTFMTTSFASFTGFNLLVSGLIRNIICKLNSNLTTLHFWKILSKFVLVSGQFLYFPTLHVFKSRKYYLYLFVHLSKC